MGLGPAIFYIVPLGLGAVALTLGILGRRRAHREPSIGRKTMATWGIALGVIALVFGVIGAVTIEDATSDLDRELDKLEREIK